MGLIEHNTYTSPKLLNCLKLYFFYIFNINSCFFLVRVLKVHFLYCADIKHLILLFDYYTGPYSNALFLGRQSVYHTFSSYKLF